MELAVNTWFFEKNVNIFKKQGLTPEFVLSMVKFNIVNFLSYNFFVKYNDWGGRNLENR